MTEPEQTTAKIFTFLGADQVPGITAECFRDAHESDGPGDDKIWFTERITSASIGRGVCVPAAALPPPIRRPINSILVELGYRTVNGDWNSVVSRPDPRADARVTCTADRQAGRTASVIAAAASAITARIESLSPGELGQISVQWPTVAGARIAIVVHTTQAQHRLSIRFPTLDDGEPHGAAPQFQAAGCPLSHAGFQTSADGDDLAVAEVIAEPATWESLLAGEANVIAEILAGRVRCVNRRDRERLRSDEVHAVAACLGLAQIPSQPEMLTIMYRPTRPGK